MATKLDAKLIEIYKAIDHIEKAGENKSQHYNYVRAADVVRAARQAFVDQKIYAEINFDFDGPVYTIARSKEPNAPFSAVNVKCSLILHDLESNETRTGSGLGTGADLGDKSSYKAQTGALKYALRNALLIPDEAGEDPEADEAVDEEAEANQVSAKRTAERNRKQEPVEAPAEDPEVVEEEDEAPQSESTAESAGEPEPAQTQTQTKEADPFEDDGTLPTEDEKNEFRARFTKIIDGLTSSKALSASKGLKVERKVVVFLMTRTKTERVGDVTKAQWTDWLSRCEAFGAKENGWQMLARLVNKANGIEK